MNIIPADYNAATVAGLLHIDFVDSRAALAAINAQAGDWIWVSDKEILVGGQLLADGEDRFLAAPRWQTVVHLDDYVEVDMPSFLTKLSQVLQRSGRSPKEETEVFQLLTVFNQIAPPDIRAATEPGSFAFRSAGALMSMGEPGLALTLLEQALLERPHDPATLFFYLDVLRQMDPAHAEAVARTRGSNPRTHATVLAACINTLAAATERLTDDEFQAAVPVILGWIDRFESAPGRDQARAPVVALVEFNRGLLLLRLGQLDEANAAFDRADATYPGEPPVAAARGLKIFDDEARDLGRRYRNQPHVWAA